VDAQIADSVESAYRMEREHGFLELGAMRMDATFAAVKRLAETQDLRVLDGCPDWLLEELRRWVQHFRNTGEFGFISNLGQSDHSKLMERVAHLFGDAI
jgi:hypothetical protein